MPMCLLAQEKAKCQRSRPPLPFPGPPTHTSFTNPPYTHAPPPHHRLRGLFLPILASARMSLVLIALALPTARLCLSTAPASPL